MSLRLTLLCMSLIYLSACRIPQPSASEGKGLRLYLAPYVVPCVGEGDPTFCYLVSKDSIEWTYFYEEIIGFNSYELGTRYTLRVSENMKENSIDAGPYDYVLEEVLTSQKIGIDVPFSIILQTDAFNRYFNYRMETPFILDSIPILFPTDSLQLKFETLTEQGQFIEGVFYYDSTYRNLILTDFAEE